METAITDPLTSEPPGPRLLGLRVHATRKLHKFEGSIFTIGRAPECDLRLDDSTVSANHAVVQREGGQWWLTELQSKNGVKVNGLPLTRPIALQPGMRIDLGHARLYAYGNVTARVDATTPRSFLDALMGYYGSLQRVGEVLRCSAMTVARMIQRARR